MKLKVPNTYVIIFSVILLCAVATWFVPGGEYTDVAAADGTGQLVKEFQKTEAQPQTWQVFSAVFKGIQQQAGIIAFVLIIGGTFWVINSTRAVDSGIRRFISQTRKLERHAFFRKIGVGNIIIVLTMLLFGLFGAVFGMSEETIAFTAIIIPLAVSLGYDSITGVCMCYVAAHVGFAGAMLNPFTVGIAQEMSGVPLFSGIEYRTICWFVLMIAAIIFVLTYAARVKQHPLKSPVHGLDQHWRDQINADETSEEKESTSKAGLSSWIVFGLTAGAALLFCTFYAEDCTVKVGTKAMECPWLPWTISGIYLISSLFSLNRSDKMFILNMLLCSILFLILGVMGYGWYITEIASLFLALGLASGIAAGYRTEKLVQEFLNGAKDIFSAALVIGFAAGIVIVLKDGKIMDPILHSMASGLGNSGKAGALASMYGIQTGINLFLPSATAKAAITMPIMSAFSDLIGVSRQATVLAFQFGDGFTNMITPCSGVLLAVLSVARIPYTVWVKWIWKFILALVILGLLLLLPTLFLEFPGF